jgi:hypothetical protein
MPSMNVDYRIEQGSTFVLEFQVFDDELVPLNLLEYDGSTYSLGPYRMRMRIRRTKYRDSTVFTCGTTQNYVVQSGQSQEFTTDGFYFLGGSTGVARFVVTSDTSNGFKPASHFYDVELVKGLSGGDVVSKLMDGRIDLDAETTK